MANILDRNTDFLTNGTVTSAGLHNLIDDTNIYAGLISTQEERTSVGTGDLLLIANSSAIGSPQIAANRTTVYNLFEDALTSGTYVNANLSNVLTVGTVSANRTISTTGTITTGTIPNLTAGTTTSTLGTITNLSSGTTNSTSVIATSGTIGTFNSTSVIATSGTIGTFNSTTGTIGNLSTTLAGDFTITQGTGTIGTSKVTPANLSQPFTRATAVASTSGTAIDFTGIPSWAKRITVAISGLSASGTSANLLRVGTSSGFVTDGYTSGVTVQGGTNAVNGANNTNGFNFSPSPAAVSVACGMLTLLNISGNTWVHASVIGFTNDSYSATGGGNIALGGTLDRVRITTVNGTDTFDAGSINIMYEG